MNEFRPPSIDESGNIGNKPCVSAEIENNVASEEGTVGRDAYRADDPPAADEPHRPGRGLGPALAVHTVGGVVTTAQSLMEIVPDDALEVELNVENKDIGFVKNDYVTEQSGAAVAAFGTNDTEADPGAATTTTALLASVTATGNTLATPLTAH